MRVVFIAALLTCLALGAPTIVIIKSVPESNVELGGVVTVTTTAINVGDAPAFDFNLRDGETSKDLASLEPQANVTFVTTLTASALGNLEIPLATASWAAAAGSEERFRATSTQVREEERDEKKHATELGPRGFVNVVTAAEYARINSRYIVETVLYVLFAAVIIGFPFGVYRSKQREVDFFVKEARKK